MKFIGMIGKVLGIIVIALILLFIVFMVIMAIISKVNNAYKGDYKSVIKSNAKDAPKALIVFQPAKSNASIKVAEQMARGLNEAGYEVTLTYPGKHLSSDLSQYSLVAFGSPVFFGRPSEAIINAAKQMKELPDKKVIIYSVGMADETSELDIMKQSLNGKEPDYKSKFKVNDEARDKKAYELGLKAGKESRGKE